ncbi:hypothetical protein Peur_066675 [Populus x canadensis]
MRTSGPHHDKETNLSLKSVSKTKKCILDVGFGSFICFWSGVVDAQYNELINVRDTARFADGIVFDRSYKRGRPLAMRIGVGKVIGRLDQGILGGEVVLSMQEGGKHKLHIPPLLAYGPEHAGCFSGDSNIPGNSTLLYHINFVRV